jgi:hypothetical protein
MNMEYWSDCIEEAFCDAEITATKEQIATVVSWVDGAHENYGMASGSENIPNPMNAEVDELKRKIESLKSAHERQLNGVAKGVSQRRNVSANDVCIDEDGLVTYK